MKTRRQRGGWPWSPKKVNALNKATRILRNHKNSNASMTRVKNLNAMRQERKNSNNTMKKYTRINVEATHNGFNKEKANANNAKALAKAKAKAKATKRVPGPFNYTRNYAGAATSSPFPISGSPVKLVSGAPVVHDSLGDKPQRFW
jgi:hypothetical protein